MTTQKRCHIRYSCVCYGQVILVSHQVECEDYTPIIHSVLESLCDAGYDKLTYPVDSFQVHVLIDEDFCFACVTKRTNEHYIPFKFLDTVKDRFSGISSLISRSLRATENEFERDFAPVLASIMYDFNIGQGDKLQELQSQVEDVKQIMLENVQKVLDRGERLDDLLSKTEDLEAGGNTFRQRTLQLYKKARCKNLKMWLIIGTFLSLVLTLAVLICLGILHL